MDQNQPLFTPTQQRLLEKFSDGGLKSKAELMTVLGDDMTDVQCLRQHIYILNKKLLPYGQKIAAISLGKAMRYQHVRLISSANNGRT